MEAVRLDEIARWCGSKYSGETVVTGVSIDSRLVQRGDLFVAIVGENADGHDYIAKAGAAGAAAALVELAVDVPIPTVKVADCQKAMSVMAAAYRKTLTLPVVAITGSVGKTTTKEMTHLILSRKYKTAKTEKNHNNELGLPLTLFSIDKSYEMAVLELGMNHFGEMSRLTAVARPDTAVIGNIGTMHIEFLGSREGILKAKLEILEGLSHGGLAVFNGDEPLLWNLRGELDQRICWFGIDNPDCDLRGENISLSDGGSTFDAVYRGERTRVTLPVEGRHNIMDALAAMAVGYEYGIRAADMAAALADFQNTGMRQKIYEAKGCVIIEDCYNAGPESTAASLTVLKNHTGGRKIAVLGDMLELGQHSKAEHEKIGRIAAKTADILIACGTEMRFAALAAKAEGGEALWCDSREKAAEALADEAKPGDVILFKGSRGMAMEKVLSAFTK